MTQGIFTQCITLCLRKSAFLIRFLVVITILGIIIKKDEFRRVVNAELLRPGIGKNLLYQLKHFAKSGFFWLRWQIPFDQPAPQIRLGYLHQGLFLQLLIYI